MPACLPTCTTPCTLSPPPPCAALCPLADYLEGIIELDSSCKVKKASEELCLIFGLPTGELVGEPIQKVRLDVVGCRRSMAEATEAEQTHPLDLPVWFLAFEAPGFGLYALVPLSESNCKPECNLNT